MTARIPGRRAAIPAAVLLALTGCSGAGDGSADDQRSRAADVTFARQALTQSAETLLLVDEAARRGVSPEASALLEEIRAQQTADVEELTDLLEGWDEKVPATARDHAHSGHGQAEGHEDLADAQAAEFEETWLDLMADQHEDALDLAETEVEEGRDDAALRLAREMVTRLEQQVAELERLEGQVGG